jgi:hypothetical protein
MEITKNELKELIFLSNDCGMDLKIFKIYFYLFKQKTSLTIEDYVEIYMDLENEYSLFSDYIQMYGPLIEPDIRIFFTTFFIPNKNKVLSYQIKLFEKSNPKTKLLNQNFKFTDNLKVLEIQYPKIKEL